MSADCVISVEKLSKRYIIGHQRDARDGLRHAIEDAFRNPFKWLLDRKKRFAATQEEFWALKDVSFEIQQGDVVGIIGRNGAGKSTLLKILSRITEPTTGRVRMKGRVASLLEVGTGFHQELSGRENIFLNGAILGMSQAEIKSKFDEIVAFSEIEKFLDTPVKRYSSGMYVRLAFAVAAHLEPEILIVDEVLAVGDAAFQKKCLGKMGQVAKGGRTVLFVSHNMPAVQALCSKAVYLQSGSVKAVGAVEPLLNQYLMENGASQSKRVGGFVKLGEALKLKSLAFTPDPVKSGEPLRFEVQLVAEKSTTVNEASILILSPNNTRVAILDFRPFGLPVSLGAGENWRLSGEIGSIPLVEGDYNVGLYINSVDFAGDVMELATFTVRPRSSSDGHPPYPVEYRGVLELDFKVNSPALQPK